ncbi:coenzyme F420-0:L-glutamate ligase [Arsenicicoccus sp. oral taxon 190]|uniref:coenzyme F420-0:L-glutamate ligase n=1 Tax=Arsenicicoccus sp. oral taxon 190 TaxID=1658671 RepID=UPI00067A314B|nr:coenzyme F420-0:L-glutamate ligase [Arsenicicoccus sp. oral taxon 190]AKT51422.1 hypothetical protein ADJ73_09010 [Arsenicicoccus sp. oral taxon 190]
MTPTPAPLHLLPVPGLPEVGDGTDLAALLAAATAHPPVGGLADGDVLAVSSKLVSKALGHRRPWDGDPRAKAQVVAAQTRRVVAERATPGGVTRIVESAAGPVMAAAGVDASNTGPDGGLLLLPDDPDAEVGRLRAALLARLPHVTRLGVLLTDTAGRPWRGGQTDFALGSAGLAVTDDLRGGHDADGRALSVTARAVADELAAAADLVKGKATGVGAVVVRGLDPAVTAPGAGAGAGSLVRTGPGDWFAVGHVEAVRAALGVPPGTPRAVAVGIRPVGEDSVAARCGRAVRLAASGLPDVSWQQLDHAPDQHVWRVACPDELSLGMATARLEVACAAEDLALRWRREAGAVRAVLSPR